MHPRAAFFGCLCLVLFLILLAGCNPVQSNRAGDGANYFRPPTAVAEQVQTPVLAQASPTPASPLLPTPTTECSDQLTFISDVTIPDGTLVQAEATLDKRWEVENSGNCNWNENYRLRLVAGPEMGATPEQALYPARSGTRAILRVVFKAPTEPGSYHSAWQAVSPQGEPFGDPFFIIIEVE